MVDAGWRGDHPIRVDDGITRTAAPYEPGVYGGAYDCTCGARRMQKHNLGCPQRDPAYLYTCLGGHQWYSDEGVQCPKCNRRASATLLPFKEKDFAKESAERKAAPLWSGVMLYFPDALMAVARLSKKANDKHNRGEPLHWSKEKSNDHGDCLTRHQLEPEKMDEEMQEIHAVHVAWRALAQLQIIIERQRGEQA